MDRMLACEAGDPGSIPGESTRYVIIKNIGSNHILILGEENFLIQYEILEKALK